MVFLELRVESIRMRILFYAKLLNSQNLLFNIFIWLAEPDSAGLALLQLS